MQSTTSLSFETNESGSPASPQIMADGEPDLATFRPKLVFFWNNAEVMKWLQRHGNEFYLKYGNYFLEHEITGRSLVRLREETLKQMGITDSKDVDALLRIILKLKLKSDIIEIKDLEKKVSQVHEAT